MPVRPLDFALRAYFNGRTIGPGAISVPYAVRAVRRIMDDEAASLDAIEAAVRAFAAERQIALSDGDRLPWSSPATSHRLEG